MISFGMEAAGPILKLLRERSVCAPQYLSAGTCTSPMVSCSILYDMKLLFLITLQRYKDIRDSRYKKWIFTGIVAGSVSPTAYSLRYQLYVDSTLSHTHGRRS